MDCASAPRSALQFREVVEQIGSISLHVWIDCGLAISHDTGSTWTYVVVDPSVPISSDQRLTGFGRPAAVKTVFELRFWFR